MCYNIIMDILIEVLLDVYLELMLLVIPEEKMSRKKKIVARLIAIGVLLGVLALAVWGLVWIIDYKNFWGILPLAVAILLSIGQISLGIILAIKKERKKTIGR